MSFQSTSHDPLSRRPIAFDNEIKIQDHNHHTYEMWMRAPGGKRVRTMLVEYSRKAR